VVDTVAAGQPTINVAVEQSSTQPARATTHHGCAVHTAGPASKLAVSLRPSGSHCLRTLPDRCARCGADVGGSIYHITSGSHPAGSAKTSSDLCTSQTTISTTTQWIDAVDHTERPRRAIPSSTATSWTTGTPTASSSSSRISSKCPLVATAPATRYRSTRRYVLHGSLPDSLLTCRWLTECSGPWTT
jgi:hypothetical protein